MSNTALASINFTFDFALVAKQTATDEEEQNPAPAAGNTVFIQALKPVQAVQVLSCYSLPVTVKQALNFLTQFEFVQNAYLVYQKYFPEDWAYWEERPAELARINYTFEDEGDIYNEIVRELFDAVHHEDLFPYDWEYHCELSGNEEYIEHIPLNSVSYDLVFEEAGDLPLGIRYIAYLLDLPQVDLSHFDRAEIGLKAYAFLLRQDALGWEFDMPTLERLCHQVAATDSANAPLVALPDAIRMLEKTTGNWWLDSDREQLSEAGFGFSWNVRDVDFLVGKWCEAKPIKERVEQLAIWLENKKQGLENLEKLVRVWKEAALWFKQD